MMMMMMMMMKFVALGGKGKNRSAHTEGDARVLN
jgi:hypothetical protein